jgi:outer membrane protein assembly factor BamA
MWQPARTFILLAGLLCIIDIAAGQTVTIQSITITGLKRTKESIVYRELTFFNGDTLQQSELGPTLERNRNNLINLGIFTEVVVNISEWNTQTNLVDITIEVKESWYIYAMPILELADRNFNTWWTTYNHAFDRLNVGGRLDWLNFTGRNDKLKAKLQFGYIPKQEIEYRFPYLGKKQSIGITTSFVHSINKEVTYATVNNQEQQVRFDERNTYILQTDPFYKI